MEETPQPTRTSFSKKKILVILAILIGIILIAIATLFILRRVALANEVTSALNTVPKSMDAASASSGNGFPVELPSDLQKLEKVKLEGGGTFDGTTYCVTGTSKQDSTVVYHIDSGAKKVSRGSCTSAVASEKPTTAPSLSLAATDTTQIGVTWQEVASSASYTVQCATNTEFTQGVVQVTAAGLSNECNDLSPSTVYYIRARANNSAGAGPWSANLNQATSDWSYAPGSLDFKAESETSVSYSWKPTDGALKYVIEWATDTSYTQEVGSVEVTTPSGIIKNLKPNTQYYFHVKTITKEFNETQAAFSETIPVSTNLAPIYIPVKDN